MCERFPNCCPPRFTSAPDKTYFTHCPAGKNGGCSNLENFDEIVERDMKIGRNFGARQGIPPVWLSKKGEMVGPSWRRPKRLGRDRSGSY